ncbi:hypothetical protein DYB30_012535 [Aphanomyces astaci]|uniref:Uncharacterized protein n=2 Tax=Aphanomyces astaci TaxID=112090 RepID=A0A397G393_APHAT|nr:hypothetical protein DYB38_007587 [Aphanomyces astaci]RHY55947.1 hypothetical protein DYB30_012535 [Aphanomyces astaci]RHY94956.1 hypothetical protein DYB26_008054 [Aphanomyces astaci]RHZ41295.1 hypothetical protein DYB31_011828 [Aphanomyces astaci]
MTDPPPPNPNNEQPATTTSRIHVTEPHWLLGESTKQQQWTLTGNALTIASGKKATLHCVTEGKVWHERDLGIQLCTESGHWLRGTATTRSQWAMWLQAFHDLTPPKATQPSPSRVQFSNHVRVRRIPSITEEDAPHLYYSSVEMATMSKALYV